VHVGSPEAASYSATERLSAASVSTSQYVCQRKITGADPSRGALSHSEDAFVPG